MPTLQTTRSALVRSLATAATAALLLATLAVPALAHSGHDHDADTSRRGQALGRISHGIGAELAQVRAATAKYHNVEVAEAAGYAPVSPCIEDLDGAGAMGIHYANPKLSAQLDPTQPQALLYHPGPNGKLRLVGVEYIDFGGEGELFGQPFTDGVPHPETRVVIPNAALHVWLWQTNPAGMFAAFNPNLSCPDA